MIISSASVRPPTTSVVSPCEPCVNFQWEDKDGETLQVGRGCFEVVVHWRHNGFLVPSGKAGKDFAFRIG